MDRNRLKRRLREIGRRRVLTRLESEGLAADVLIRARPAAYAAPFAELEDAVCRVVEVLCSDVA